MKPPCRCKHPEHNHVWSYGRPGRCWCGCPEYRPAETADTQTLRGVGPR